MRELIDCHIHTQRCGHAIGSASEYLLAARVAGLSAVVMTEHLPLPEGLDPEGCYAMSLPEISEYAEEVRSAAASTPELQVVLGAEADWLPGRAAEALAVRTQAREAGIDVLLGSVHFLEEWTFDDPELIDEWDRRDVAVVWEQYFATWCDAAASGEFDVMAHPDLVKKFGHRPAGDVSELYEAAARAAASSGVMIEASSGGLRKPVGEIYPGPELLETFCRHGVAATAGSDAHAPAEVGIYIDRVYAALANAGYRHVSLPLGRGESRRIEL